MKINFVGELRSVIKGKEFTRKNGEKDCNVALTVEVDGRSQYFNCHSDILKAWDNGVIEKGNICQFEADYNPQFKYNQFVVTSVVAQK